MQKKIYHLFICLLCSLFTKKNYKIKRDKFFKNFVLKDTFKFLSFWNFYKRGFLYKEKNTLSSSKYFLDLKNQFYCLIF